MNICDLPKGKAPSALTFDHFPTRQQTFIWRNWGLVEPNRLAKVIGTTLNNVCDLAEDMGLDPKPQISADWLSKGYVTIIRNNWHLLPYEQLLVLLGWLPEKLDYTLREEDFLYHKLGDLKPQCDRLIYRPLSEEKTYQTVKLREWTKLHFEQADFEFTQKPFEFYEHLPVLLDIAKEKSNTKNFSNKIVYAYSAPYGDTLMCDLNDLYPDVLLKQLAAAGINGIWLQVVLYTLFPWNIAPELSEGYQQRLKTLNKLVSRAAEYGIGVYLYLNEPRPMTKSFFEKNPDWPAGVADESGEHISLCTSNPRTLKFVYDATKFVFEKVPGLAGAITISMSENLVHCHARGKGHDCPRCNSRKPEDVVVELNQTISDAVHSASSGAKVIVWTWAWGEEWAERAVDMLPDNIELMCVSEWGLPTNIGEVAGSVKDYSISQVGPSETAKNLWRRAKFRDLKVHAKVQINTTWECSAMPYIPVATLVEKHLENLINEGIDGILASWTLGGYPGGNLSLLNYSPEQLAEFYGGSASKKIVQAWKIFSNAFKEFPFSLDVLYFAPQNIGPANLLFWEPTGYEATMVGLPYDDLKKWRSIYPEDIFENQWKKLSLQWANGLELLSEIKNDISDEKFRAFSDIYRVSRACYCHFRSTYLQIAFLRLRGSKENTAQLIEILDEEIDLAMKLEAIVLEDSRIGFEATNHYIYTPNDLREKVLNCEYLKQRIKNDEC